MFDIKIDSSVLSRRFTEYEQKVLPAATATALNDSMFHVREGFKREFQKVFDRPTPFIMNSVLYKKATKRKLVAEVFILYDISAGTPPVKTLFAQTVGGKRDQKTFEKRLSVTGATYPHKFFVPGSSFPRDAYGNISKGQYAKVLAQLHAQFDPKDNETQFKRGRRLRRQARKGGGGSYFALYRDRGKLKAGTVYERIVTGFGSTVRAALVPVRQPNYRVRFDLKPVSQRLFNASFPGAFNRRLAEFTAGVR